MLQLLHAVNSMKITKTNIEIKVKITSLYSTLMYIFLYNCFSDFEISLNFVNFLGKSIKDNWYLFNR